MHIECGHGKHSIGRLCLGSVFQEICSTTALFIAVQLENGERLSQKKPCKRELKIEFSRPKIILKIKKSLQAKQIIVISVLTTTLVVKVFLAKILMA